MKVKNLIIGILALSSSFMSAQEKGQISGFGGLNYYIASGGSAIGFNVGAEYLFTDNISIAPSYTMHNTEGGDTSEINIDGRYYFVVDKQINWFAVAGYRSFSQSAQGQPSVTSGGFSAGAGGLYKISDKLSIVAQAKYGSVKLLSGTNILAGIQYAFN